MIKNIIFDVGNVLIGYRWKEMFTDDFGISEAEAERIGHQLFTDNLWKELDLGTKTGLEVKEEFCRKFPADSPLIGRFFDECYRMSVDRPKVWEKVEKLGKIGYKRYILSNYSKYMFDRQTKNIPFFEDFDGQIISYEVNLVKPDKEIYNKLLDKYRLDPKECVFLDDLEANTKAAEMLGIKSYTILSEKHLIELLDNFIENDYGSI